MRTVSLPSGYTLYSFTTVKSTNSLARQLAEQPDTNNTVIWAKEQTGGRGRGERRWISPPGNLYATVLLRNVGSLHKVAILSLAAAVAMGEAVAQGLPNMTQIQHKWPNDLLLDGAKVCGLLLESGTSPDGRSWLAIGSGVNVASHPSDIPYPVTHLKAHGWQGTLQNLLEAYAARLDDWLTRWRKEGAAPVREAWLNRAAGVGSPLTVRLGEGKSASGRFVGLDPSGALRLELPNGTLRTITAGDVFFPVVKSECL